MVMTVGMVDPKASDMGARAGADQGGVVWSPGASPPPWLVHHCRRELAAGQSEVARGWGAARAGGLSE